MSTPQPVSGQPLSAPQKRQRDLRLDFFRGMAMFIILLAHTPGNSWTLWIPARFGFSDATEIFVFCSGMASGIAFGSVFLKKSWFLGAARICFRVWQVYWAHIGVVLATALLMVLIDLTQFGTPGKVYADWFPVNGIFNNTGPTLVGLFTLTYIPGLFDILPMYLVILAMVPIVMAIYRVGGREAVFAFIAVVWLCANLAGYARKMADAEDLSAIQAAAVWAGDYFTWMNFPGMLWSRNPDVAANSTWFFNPFGWQLVFFTGFCFTMGWIPAPPVTRTLVWIAIAVIVITTPFAWHKMFQYMTGFVPDSMVGRALWDAREFIEPVRWKTWVGGWRYLHFIAVAYLAFAAAGPGGIRLNTGWGVIQRAAGTRSLIRCITGVVLLLTFPYTYISEIKYLVPALDAWFFNNIPLVDGRYLGILHLIHLTALIMLIWHSIGDAWRQWLVRDAFLACVPVIRKVGTQSLAVFLVSIVLSRFNGAWMDGIDAWLATSDWTYITERDVWVRAMVNLTGFGVLIATAYFCGWMKSQPWRDKAKTAKPAPDSQNRPQAVPAE
ncbi:MAG: OpgC domain-containing protein [Pseudomonadota bacterium]